MQLLGMPYIHIYMQAYVCLIYISVYMQAYVYGTYMYAGIEGALYAYVHAGLFVP